MSAGTKYDDGKPGYHLIPAYPLEELAKLYTMGAKKYGERNWEKGIEWGRLFRAMISHAWKWWRGETYDKQDGQHHLASVAWGALCLMEYEKTHPKLDDRPRKDLDDSREVAADAFSPPI